VDICLFVCIFLSFTFVVNMFINISLFLLTGYQQVLRISILIISLQCADAQGMSIKVSNAAAELGYLLLMEVRHKSQRRTRSVVRCLATAHFY